MASPEGDPSPFTDVQVPDSAVPVPERVALRPFPRQLLHLHPLHSQEH